MDLRFLKNMEYILVKDIEYILIIGKSWEKKRVHISFCHVRIHD